MRALVVAVLVVAACGSSGDTSVRTQDQSREAQAARQAAREANRPDAGPSPDARPAAKLPSTKLYAKAIIGKGSSDLEKTLGVPVVAGDVESEWKVGDVDVLVHFEEGKATYYRVSSNLFLRSDLRAWGAADLPDPKGKIVFVDDNEPEVWDAKALKEHRRWLGKSTREGMAMIFENQLRDAGFAAKLEAIGKENTTLRIRWDGCDEVELDTLMDMPDFTAGLEKAGFLLVTCDNGFQTFKEKL